MNQAAEHEQIHHAAEHIAGHPLAETEAQRLATAMPLLVWLITNRVRGVDAFLRSLPDDLFGLLCYVAREFWTLIDAYDPETWDAEWTCLVTRLVWDETGVNDISYEELSYAAISLAQLVRVEQLRREGCYAWIEPYRLLATEWPKRIPSRRSGTEH